LCGAGKQSRKVSCYRKVDKKINVLNDDECETEKPKTEKSCELRPCEGVDWVTSAWSGVRKTPPILYFSSTLNILLF